MNQKRSTPLKSRESLQTGIDLGDGDKPNVHDYSQQAPSLLEGMNPCDQVSYLGGIKLANLWMLAHRMREDYFEDGLFTDPPWDILMELHCADSRNERVKITSLSATARVPPSTSSRWARALTERGLIVREKDPSDKRRIYLRLSDRGKMLMRAYFDALTKKAAKIMDP